MILYKNNNSESIFFQLNWLGWCYILETKNHIIGISIVSGLIDTIDARRKCSMKEPEKKEYDVCIAENYQEHAYSSDIQLVKGQKIRILGRAHYPYKSNVHTV
tara:strand:+ start:2090 stop:2398 length:309 start_codon:yes stop_codon:yes gene_type:complete